MTRRRFVLFPLVLLMGPPVRAGEAHATIARVAVASTSLASVGYDREGQVLEIEFCSGAVYRYLAVPERVHRELLAAVSKGRYFSSHIRERYRFQRMPDARPSDSRSTRFGCLPCSC
jgi:hypothetical protein